MAIILCIESSYSLCSVALLNGSVIHSREGEVPQNHAETLMGLISDCILAAGIKMQELQAVAISGGPGSYTGLRIGASTAKGICFALGIPLIAIDTLKSMARVGLVLHPEHKGLIWPMIDARRMEVYHCVFDAALEQVTQVSSGIIDEEGFKPDFIGSDTLLCGDGAIKAAAMLQLRSVPVLPHAGHLCLPASEAFDLGNFADLASYEPFYLKPANITKPSLR